MSTRLRSIRWRSALAVVTAVLLAAAMTGQAAAAITEHRVERGDSLFRLAQTYGTTVDAIRSENGIRGDLILVGQTLAIPEAETMHTVRSGETLWRISQHYGVSLHALRRANDRWDDLIYPGERLRIPHASATASSRSGAAGISVTAAERDLMARMVAAEAGDQPYRGKVAVAAVILNRVASNQFPNTIEGVLYQPWQFEPVRNNWLWRAPVTQEEYRAVDDALNGVDPTGGALYFFNPAKAWNAFMWSRPHAVTIGDHRFMY